MILLDTHVWLWLLHNPSQLSESAQDPADRILVAIARRYEISLVTCDAKILNYPFVKTIW